MMKGQSGRFDPESLRNFRGKYDGIFRKGERPELPPTFAETTRRFNDEMLKVGIEACRILATAGHNAASLFKGPDDE